VLDRVDVVEQVADGRDGLQRDLAGQRAAIGLASTAITRSPRRLARVAPRVTVVVVLPTPPLSEITAIR
jgi:hypothetical protein